MKAGTIARLRAELGEQRRQAAAAATHAASVAEQLGREKAALDDSLTRTQHQVFRASRAPSSVEMRTSEKLMKRCIL